jgi:hypothetical protein
MSFNPEAAMATAQLARLTPLAPHLAKLVTGIRQQDDWMVAAALSELAVDPKAPMDLQRGAQRLAAKVQP